jgi:hypothetical protein
LSIVSTGAQSYTVGPGGQLNTNVQSAFGVLGMGVSGGNGYAVGDSVVLGGTPIATQQVACTVIVSAIGPGGSITSITISSPGTFVGNLPTSFSQVSTSGLGVGANFYTPIWEQVTAGSLVGSVRPDRLESGNFLRQISLPSPNQIDYPLEILESREDYNKIALKNLTSFPGYIFYDPSHPLGVIYPWPVPQANIYEIHILIKEQISVFSNQAQAFALPFMYYQALVANLAMRLRSKYQIPTFPGDPLPALAKQALANLRGANAAIARLRLPSDMNRSGIYNIFSDQFY